MVVMDDSIAPGRTTRVLSEQERAELIQMVSSWRLLGERRGASGQEADA
jgi:hypothetical protein